MSAGLAGCPGKLYLLSSHSGLGMQGGGCQWSMHCCWSCPWPLGTCATAISTSMASDTDQPSLEHAGRGCMAVRWRGVVLRTCAGDLCTGQGKESLSAFPHQQKHTAAFSRVNTTSPKLCCTLLHNWPCSQSYHAVHISNCCLLPVPLPAEGSSYNKSS